jgi:hypothetical protein
VRLFGHKAANAAPIKGTIMRRRDFILGGW